MKKLLEVIVMYQDNANAYFEVNQVKVKVYFWFNWVQYQELQMTLTQLMVATK